MKKNNFSHFGFSTLLLAFTMICIVTFSALSFVTAHSDYNLSKRVADNNSAYYEASEKSKRTICVHGGNFVVLRRFISLS